ncbi:MAG: tetratricopeptide repeat protein [Gemmataceae bacterium]|nr:tetratricopeptide repeat protein [Gemmataceae bacterium]
MQGRIPVGIALLAALLALVAAAPALAAQIPEDRPQLYVPKQPPTAAERERRAALHQYVLGLLCQRDDRLLEALKAFEESARLDPTAAAPFKAQIPLLAALDRGRDAVAAAEKARALNPEDYEVWFVCARIRKGLGQFTEAQKDMQRGLATKSILERPDIAQAMWLELAGMHELADEVEPAVKALSEAAAILDHPDLILDHGPFDRSVILGKAADTYERLGNIYRKTKKYPEAIAAYQKAQERTPENSGRLNYNLAQLCQEEGKHAEALGYVDAYLQRQPLGTEAYEMKVKLLTHLKRTDEIVPWLEKASAADRYNIGVKLLLAKQCVQAKRLAQAEKAYVALAEEAPSAEVFQGLFRVYQQDAAGSVRTLELVNRTLEQAAQKPIAPTSVHAAGQAKLMIAALRDDSDLARDLVRAAHRRGEPPQALQLETIQLLAALADRYDLPLEAERFYRQALARAGAAAEPILYGGLLRVLWKSRKYEDVLKVCQDGLANAKATNHVLFHAELAKGQARLGRHEEALRCADRALALAGDKERLTLRLLRVRILTQAEQFAQAEQESLGLLKEHPQLGDTMEIRYLLSNVYNSWKKLAACEEQLEHILKIDPNNATANNDLGYIWADHNKNLPQAEEMIRKALELDRLQRKRLSGGAALPDNAAYVDSLGWVLFRRGQVAEARRELERAAQLPDGDDPVIWDHLGDVYERLQMTSQARTAWEKALHLYEQEQRRRLDDRYRELRRKLQAATAGTK